MVNSSSIVKATRDYLVRHALLISLLRHSRMSLKQSEGSIGDVTGGILPATHPLTAEVLDRILRKVWRLVGARL